MALPREEFKRRFPMLELEAEKACSGCLLPLFAVLSDMAEGRLPIIATTIVMGKEARLKEGKKYLFIGDCTEKRWGEGACVAGCPPSREEIKKALRGR